MANHRMDERRMARSSPTRLPKSVVKMPPIQPGSGPCSVMISPEAKGKSQLAGSVKSMETTSASSRLSAEDHKSRPKSPERIKIVKRASKRNRGILCAASCVTFRGVGLRSSIRGTVETLTDLFYRSGLSS